MMKHFAPFILAMGLMLISQIAPASVAVPMSIEELYSSSATVVHGTVVEKHTDAYKNKIYTINTVLVSDSFKGTATKNGTVDVITIGGQIGPFGATSPGAPELAVEEEVVLFLSAPVDEKPAVKSVKIDRESPFVTNPSILGGFQGKFTVKRTEIEFQAGDKSLTAEKNLIVRAVPGRPLISDSNPSLDVFLEGLESLQARASTKSVVTKTKTIPTVGTVEVIEEQADLEQLRFFDPLHRTAAKDMAKKKQAEQTKDGEAEKPE